MAQRWPLMHDPTGQVLLDDTEAFCASVIHKARLGLQPHDDFEDLLAECVAACWRIAERFDPGRGVRFSTFATRPVYCAAVGWVRKHRGRTRWVFKDSVHERKLPSLVGFDDDRNGLDRLEAAQPAWDGDLAIDRGSDLARLLHDGGRDRARDLAELGLDPAPRTA